ncbi:type I-F CRISPR-associated protein Csy1 [Pokkaliibacter sp. MBI-7]|uniref:type I-F CRISPR-associated protein Csy1 n=1 Tax=Pokkaliibacter sp. MBI-7 TaxID=3040600 RepID=UPI00244B2202|nr:type I-F CRISPR-associated protein Csy1 [Pokkaliibacter sp. MBI-7]MDH2434354.1 type I-F CRISPR-associated protein Csy1 [Pokkaliibacter sp. MBI-7]
MENLSTQALSQQIADYIHSRANDRLEKYDKETASLLKASAPESQALFQQERLSQRKEVEEKFIPHLWLTDAAQRAGQLQLVTHALKYIHSDAKGTSIYATMSLQANAGYISSNVLSDYSIDVVGNAAALDVGKLLQLPSYNAPTTADNPLLIDFIRQDDCSPLLPFAQTDAQAQEWLALFKQAITATAPSSHKLAKQVYWPVEDGYHLLSPLFATSLAQAMFTRIQDARFSDHSKTLRDMRRKSLYAEGEIVDYPDLAIQNFGGTKPQNISQLNSSRGGKAYLLNSAPPHWQPQEKLPYHLDSVFEGPFSRLVYQRIESLRYFLEHNVKKPSNRYLRLERARRVEEIVDELVSFSARYNTGQFAPDWSRHPDCKLPLHQQLWLNPQRYSLDETFAYQHDRKEWQKKVAADFSRFLNKRLEAGNKLHLKQPDYAQWLVLTAQELRLINQEIEEAL